MELVDAMLCLPNEPNGVAGVQYRLVRLPSEAQPGVQMMGSLFKGNCSASKA